MDLTHRTLCRLLSDPADVALTSTLGPDDWRLLALWNKSYSNSDSAEGAYSTGLAATAQREGVAPLLHHTLKEPRRGGEQTYLPTTSGVCTCKGAVVYYVRAQRVRDNRRAHRWKR